MKLKLNRREFLRTVGFGAASAAMSSCNGNENKWFHPQAAPKPNIVYIMTDDHASHALSCYGSKINFTPNLDRIANEGMLFQNSFCTNSICAPCRAVVLTGKFNHLNGVIDNVERFDGSQQTFPKLLQEAGYQTAMIGKWHLKSEPTGFNYWNVLPGQGVYYNPVLIEMGVRKEHAGYVTDIITDFALNFLKNRDKKKPFCLMYHHKAPHRNWQPGPKYLKLYDNVNIPEPDNLFDDYANRGRAAKEQDMSIEKTLNNNDLKLVPPRNLTPEQKQAWDESYGPKNEAFRKADLQGKDLIRWKYQRYMKDYLRCIASVDENVGRLLDFLDRENLSKNTVVVYTSDQGFYLGDHGWFDKRFIYEESLRMPLLIRYPQEVKPGSVNDALVQNLDFAPTFLDYAGVKIPPDMQGRSLRPTLKGKTPHNWRKSIYYHYYEYPAVHSVKRHYGLRTKRYKLIHFYYDIDEWELYDLMKDPREMNNVYNDPANTKIIQDLHGELQRLRKQYGDSDELTQKFLNQWLDRQRKRKKPQPKKG
jgi:arylsulfatase A-like enzyme